MKVYLVDDDPISLFLSKQIIARGQFSDGVTAFLDAPALLEVLSRPEADPPNLLFLDLNMPIMDGWEFLEAVKDHPGLQQHRCRIYILTSSLDGQDRVRMKAYPMVAGLIHKPLKPEDLEMIRSDFARTPESGGQEKAV